MIKRKLLMLSKSELFPWSIRKKILLICNIKVGEKSEIRPRCFINSPYVSIGENCLINWNVQLFSGYDMQSKIVIEDNVFIGMNSLLCTISHEIGQEDLRAGENTYKEITVGKGSWLGANSVILQGVKIGKGVIIAAGSVVIKDCEDNYLYAGNPARKVKKLL